MNAKKKLIAVSMISTAVAVLAFVSPASADDRRDFRRVERHVVARHTPPPAVRHADFRHAQPQRAPVVVRKVVHQRPVYVQAPAYYGEPHHDDGHNAAGAIAGAVIGGVIGSQVGDHDTRGITTVIGAVFGGILGSGF